MIQRAMSTSKQLISSGEHATLSIGWYLTKCVWTLMMLAVPVTPVALLMFFLEGMGSFGGSSGGGGGLGAAETLWLFGIVVAVIVFSVLYKLHYKRTHERLRSINQGRTVACWLSLGVTWIVWCICIGITVLAEDMWLLKGTLGFMCLIVFPFNMGTVDRAIETRVENGDD
ncbi:hypothetical protein JD969_12255 [Planctomycetota bacterium]|nr:hypothetical protein JD969_12255 [Planctomycetota bacterium]